MPLYEVMFIIVPDLESEDTEKANSKVKEAVEKVGGQVVYENIMGKQKLAYEINDYKEGFYVLLHVQGEHVIVDELEHVFKVNEEYLRKIIIKIGEEQTDVQPPEEVEEQGETDEQEESEGREEKEVADAVENEEAVEAEEE